MLIACRLLTLLLLAAIPPLVLSADPAEPDGLSSALESRQNGDLDSAWRQLSELIEKGSQDPRVHIARGVLATEMGRPGDQDLRNGAALEAASGNSRLVNSLLETVHGPLRATIEKIRFEARAALKPDPVAESLKGVFREALELRRTGNAAAALEKFEQLTKFGNDPRYFYMHGILLAESGNSAAASELFSQAITRESSLRDMQLVNDMLSGLDGRLRLLIEQQAKVEVGGEVITRRLLRDELRRRALLSEEQLLAEANAAAAAADQQADAARDNRRRSAVEQILAERARQEAREQQMAETLVPKSETPTEPAVVATDTPTAPTPTPAPATNPAAPKNSANPFLSGQPKPPARPATSDPSPTSSPATGTLNANWLPANTELLIAIRPADIIASPSVQAVGGAAAIDASLPMLQPLGLSVADIQSANFGISDVLLTFGPLLTQAAAGTPPNPEAQMQALSRKGIAVLHLAKDIDVAAIASATQARQATADDVTYYVAPPPAPEQPEVAWFAPDTKTVVTGSEEAIKKAIADGPGESTLENFAFVPGNNQVVVAFSSPLLAGLSAAINAPPNAPAPVGALADAVKGKINGAAIAVNYDNDVALEILLNLIDEDAATDAGKSLNETLAIAKQMAPLVMGQVPQPLAPGLQETINSLAATARSTVVSLSTTIPASLIEAIQQNPGLLMPQGLPGAPGLPGQGAPGGLPLPPGFPAPPSPPGTR